MDDEEKVTWWEKHGAKTIFIVVLLLACIAIYFSSKFYRDQFGTFLSNDKETWGQFGDYFGGLLNPVLSFFALVALLYTIIIQSTELKETRRELKKSSKALDAQSESLVLQSFENTFLKLLDRHTDTISFLSFGKEKGYPIIVEAVKRIESNLNTKATKPDFVFLCALRNVYNSQLEIMDLRRLINESFIILDLLIAAENNLSFKKLKVDFNLYVNAFKGQYSSKELTLFYLQNIVFPNYKYKRFFSDYLFFENLQVDHITELRNYIEESGGGNNYEKFIYLSHKKEKNCTK